jgi:hypothetical protein
VGFVATGLYVAYKAGEADDDPIESWLKRSIAGTAPEKMSQRDEVEQYNALFTLPLEVSLQGHGALGAHITEVRVDAPALDPQSRLDWRLEIVRADSARSTYVVHDSLRLNGEKPTPSIPYEFTAAYAGSMGAEMIIVTDVSRVSPQGANVRLRVESSIRSAGTRDPLSGDILKSHKHCLQQMRLLVKYLPLADTAPDWVLPDANGQTEAYWLR